MYILLTILSLTDYKYIINVYMSAKLSIWLRKYKSYLNVKGSSVPWYPCQRDFQKKVEAARTTDPSKANGRYAAEGAVSKAD